MDLLSQRIELQGFEKSYDPEGDGDCFYKAAAFQLGRDETDLKNEIFDFLAQNQYDVSVIYCRLTDSLAWSKKVTSFNVYNTETMPGPVNLNCMQQVYVFWESILKF